MEHIQEQGSKELKTDSMFGIAQPSGILESLSMQYLYTRFNNTNGGIEGNKCSNQSGKLDK
jgi:hypothetical protein